MPRIANFGAELLRMHGRRFGSIAAATAARSAFGLALAAVLVSRHPPAMTVEFFQLFLLQSILITFVSGSGYLHAVAASETRSHALGLLRGYILFVVLTVVVISAVEVAAPRSLVDRFVSPDRWKFYVLILGGAATALHGMLQGLVVRYIGTFRTFLPVTIVSLIGAIVVILPGLSAPALIAIFAGSQIVSLLGLLCYSVVRRMLGDAIADLARGRRISLIGTPARHHAGHAFWFGAINTASLLIVYVFRDIWSAHVDPTLAQGAFFALRVSETYLQILTFGVAETTGLKRLRGPFAQSTYLKVGALVAATCLVLIAVVAGILHAHLAIPLIVVCLFIQGLCEVVRVPAALTSMTSLQTGRPVLYGLVVLPAAAVAAMAGHYLITSKDLMGIYVFLLLMPAFQIMSFLASQVVEVRGARKSDLSGA